MNADPNQPIQFDKADFAGEATLTCAACKAPITSEYYQANGQTICPTCRDQVAKIGIGGSGAARFGKALIAGFGAGFLGFLLYYFVLKITGYNIGLIAIAVGWMVGTAVRWGSEGRGGRLYQILAAILAYIAACATYAPFIMEGHSGIVQWIIALIFSMAVPWLEGPSNIIGWVILGFAVYQAWIMNRPAHIEIAGPFFTRQAPPPAAI
jgi:hypothetical protein